MDMQVDSKRIKSEREKRAWSQEQFADIAGLGVRTIQRIETSGTVSPETVKSIAAALELAVEQIIVIPEQPREPNLKLKRYAIGLVAVLALFGASLLIARPYQQEFFLLSYQVEYDGRLLANRILIDAEETQQLSIGKEYRMDVTASVVRSPTDKYVENYLARILLDIGIHASEGDGGEFSAVANPRVVTKDNDNALVRLGGDSKENLFEVSIRPKLFKEWRLAIFDTL